MTDALVEYLRVIPKAELHLHFQGAVRPATLLELARRNRVDLPATTLEELRGWFTFRDFAHFLGVYGAVCACLRRAEDYELAAYELGEELARQHVRYAEVTFTPGNHERRHVPADQYLGGLGRGRERARRDFGVEMNWVFDVVRSASNKAELAEYATAVAIEGREVGVVALGLGGGEAGHPPEEFAPWFERARAAGLRSAPHAGEVVGPESVWGALRALGADRIGHGVRAVEDPALVAHLAEAGVALEVCPTSNVLLGVYPSLAEHPLRALHEAGVAVTVNSDDPPLFGTSMTDEVLLLHTAFGLGADAIDAIVLNAVRHAFLPPERKGEMERRFTAEMAEARARFDP